MPDLQLQLSNTLIVRGRGVHFCVTNLNPYTVSGIELQSINEDGMLADRVYLGGTIPPYSMGCFSHSLDMWATTGHALLRVTATGAGRTVYSNIHYAFLTSEIYPPIPWDETRPVYMMGMAGGLIYGGFYKGSRIPRPRFIDYLVLDDVMTGSTAVLTRRDLENGVQPTFRKNVVYQLRGEYDFKSKEVLANIILSQVPILTEWFDVSRLSYDQIIDLGLPFLADKLLREKGIVAIRRTGDTSLEFVTHIASAGAPWLLIALGIGALLGIGFYILRRQEIHEAWDRAKHRILAAIAMKIREEVWNLFWLQFDNIDPTCFLVPKEQLRDQANQLKEKGDKELGNYMNALDTATGDGEKEKPAEISFWDKVKYGLIGAGAAVLLARGAPVVTPYIIERVRREE